MSFRTSQDFYAGLLFVAFGGFALIAAQRYAMGTAARMGPGFFPTLLAALLIAVGLGVTVKAALSPGERVPPVNIRVLLLILGGILLFAAALEYLGLVLAGFGMVALVGLASDQHTWRATLLTAAVLSGAAWAIFILGLGLPYAVWPPVLAG